MGYSAKEIAHQSGLSVKSIDSHRYRLMKTLGVRGRIELTRYAIEHGLVDVMELPESPEPVELSERQREVVALAGAGLSVREMAELLSLSVRSVDSHKHKAMHRLDIHDAVRLVHYCVRHDLKSSAGPPVSDSDCAEGPESPAPDADR